MFDFAGILILVVLITLFAFLFVRAWGSKRVWLKWPGLVLAGLLTLLLTLVLVIAIIGFVKLNAPPGNPVSNLKVQGTKEQVARGEKLAVMCTGCHSTQQKFPLDGGKSNFMEIPNGPTLGILYAPNLTPDGEIKDWSDGEVIRAIREGVDKSGRPLIVMPSEVLRYLSDEDVQSIVAFLRTQPPVKRERPAPNSFNLQAAIMLGAGIVNTAVQPPITQPVKAPPAGPTAEYGQYLTSFAGCRACHGDDFAGAPGGLAPQGPNLTAIVPKYSEADFFKVIRTGVTPQGKMLDNEQMPWKEYTVMFDDNDIKAAYAFLKNLKLIDKSKK